MMGPDLNKSTEPSMPATTIRILRESLNLARYAAVPIIVDDRPQADPVWLSGLRDRLIGLLARVDAEIAGDQHSPAVSAPWSDDEQRLFGQWLHRNYPDLPGDMVIGLGDAWKDGPQAGRGSQTVQHREPEKQPRSCRSLPFLIARSQHSDPGLPKHDTTSLADVHQLVSSPAKWTDEVNTEAVDRGLDRTEVDQPATPDALPHGPLPFTQYVIRKSSIEHAEHRRLRQRERGLLDKARIREICSQYVRLFVRKQQEVRMQGKTLFLERVVSRTREWQCRFPALSASSHIDSSISQGRQIVVTATTPDGIRCVFFSNHGSVLDFAATWDELERAKTWWYFVRRWNFWIVGSEPELHLLRTGDDPAIYGAALGSAPTELTNGSQFLALLDRAEQRARGFVDVVAAPLSPNLNTTEDSSIPEAV
jgi:hypothetical protein